MDMSSDYHPALEHDHVECTLLNSRYPPRKLLRERLVSETRTARGETLFKFGVDPQSILAVSATNREHLGVGMYVVLVTTGPGEGLDGMTDTEIGRSERGPFPEKAMMTQTKRQSSQGEDT